MVKQSFEFNSIYTVEGLALHDQKFVAILQQESPDLWWQLQAFRAGDLPSHEQSQVMLALAPFLEQYIASQLGIEAELEALAASLLSHDPLFAFKKRFIASRVKKRLRDTQALDDFSHLDQQLLKQMGDAAQHPDRELATAKCALVWIETQQNDALALLEAWCVQAIATPQGRAATDHWVSLRLPKRVDPLQLVSKVSVPYEHDHCYESLHFRPRRGFSLTDVGMPERAVQNEVHYCVYCHDKNTDFCSKGFPVKKQVPDLGLKRDVFGDIQTGCPLDEKISEMHTLMLEGHVLAALAMIMVDNPMCPATGHRICNDCMKSCIYQKQDPVNIPEVETSVLKQVLSLPWGVEIYNWLLRWNPLRQTGYQLQAYDDRKVMVMGMGPAGFSAAYYLLMAGCAVVGLDGLKLEPLPKDWLDNPIQDYQNLVQDLSERTIWGFGGVAEYGITVRWDKNFLTLIYLSLMRFQHFQAFGGVRFGGTIHIEDAWALGFDHLTMAVGAGLPRELRIPGSLSPGMRQANDFLMALQLSNAGHRQSASNLSVRLPALVIGGGLTAVDTATEVQAYYVEQIKKIQHRYLRLAIVLGEEALRKEFSEEDLAILDEWLMHANELDVAEKDAKEKKQSLDLLSLIRRWGGVAIVYRGHMAHSPAYRRNHEELDKALQEGIYYYEGYSPHSVMLDATGHVSGLRCQRRQEDTEGRVTWSREMHALSARNIYVATGAKPNIAYAFEHPEALVRESYEYQAYEEDASGGLTQVHFPEHVKSEHFGAFTSYRQEDKRVSFLGDTHPLFHGSVVKAIASAKRSVPKILARISKQNKASVGSYEQFAQKMQALFSARLLSKEVLAPGVICLRIAAAQASSHFQPGHFYRLQNLASQVDRSFEVSEGVALLATDVSEGELSFVCTGEGASTKQLQAIRPGDGVALMGPSGVRMRVPEAGKTVVVLASWDSIPLLLAYAEAVQQAGASLIVLLRLQKGEPMYWLDRLQQAVEALWWSSPEDQRAQSLLHEGEQEGLKAYAWLQKQLQGRLVDQCVIHGQAQRIAYWRQWANKELSPLCHENTRHFSSVYGPMQCMLKGVCAQCLVWQKDPKTGERTKAVYSCSWQDQPSHLVDWDSLDQRLKQNRAQEVMTRLWQRHGLS